MSAQIIEVIKTDLTTRGNGRETLIRVITQYWSKEGNLLAEIDPCPEWLRTIDNMSSRCRDALSRLETIKETNPEINLDSDILNLRNALLLAKQTTEACP